MSLSDVQDILKRIEEQLPTVVDLDPQAEQAIQDLLNLVEHLVAHQEALVREVQRLKQQLDRKKQTKTTNSADDDKPDTNHSSEKRHRKRQQPKPRPAGDHRSFKDCVLPVSLQNPCWRGDRGEKSGATAGISEGCRQPSVEFRSCLLQLSLDFCFPPRSL